MIVRIYSIYDKKAAVFHKPFTNQNDVIASREFQMACQDPKVVQLSVFPDDFDLYYLGDFDDNTGEMIQKNKPAFVVAAASFKKLQQEMNNNG